MMTFPVLYLLQKQKNLSADAIEMEKLKLLQQMSTAFLAGRSSVDCDSNLGAKVSKELKLIKNSVIKTRVKRKIMKDLYEPQENDSLNAETCASYQILPTHPLSSSLYMHNIQPSPHTFITPQAPPQHMPPPSTDTQLTNQYQLENSTLSFRRMLELEEDDD